MNNELNWEEISDKAKSLSYDLQMTAKKLTEREDYSPMVGCAEVERIEENSERLLGIHHVLAIISETRNGYVSREVLAAFADAIKEAEATIAFHEAGKYHMHTDEIAF